MDECVHLVFGQGTFAIDGDFRILTGRFFAGGNGDAARFVESVGHFDGRTFRHRVRQFRNAAFPKQRARDRIGCVAFEDLDADPALIRFVRLKGLRFRERKRRVPRNHNVVDGFARLGIKCDDAQSVRVDVFLAYALEHAFEFFAARRSVGAEFRFENRRVNRRTFGHRRVRVQFGVGFDSGQVFEHVADLRHERRTSDQHDSVELPELKVGLLEYEFRRVGGSLQQVSR